MLEEVEIRASCTSERDDLAIDYGIWGQVPQSLKNVLVLTAERFSSSRIETELHLHWSLAHGIHPA
jgi:hypothetical protein